MAGTSHIIGRFLVLSIHDGRTPPHTRPGIQHSVSSELGFGP